MKIINLDGSDTFILFMHFFVYLNSVLLVLYYIHLMSPFYTRATTKFQLWLDPKGHSIVLVDDELGYRLVRQPKVEGAVGCVPLVKARECEDSGIFQISNV